MIRAVKRYINNPIISFTVVIKGPVAKAGSILNLFSRRGVMVPNKDAKTITINKAMLTDNVKA